MTEQQWWADHENLAEVARRMHNEGDEVSEILYMLEKPWKFEDYWKATQPPDLTTILAEEAEAAEAGRDLPFPPVHRIHPRSES